MISHFFPCCNNQQSVDSFQSTDNHFPRKIISKNKTWNTLTSPKSSLKTLASMRNQKNHKELNKSANIHLLSTVDLANFESEKNVQFPSPSVTRQNERPIQVSFRQSIKKTPPPVFYKGTTTKIMKQIINFTYKNPNNPQMYAEKSIIPTAKSNTRVKEIDIQHEKLQVGEPLQQMDRSNNIISNQKVQQTPKSSSVKNNIALPPTPKFRLGGSKFTILSEEAAEENGQLRVEQSAILLNVFHPTKSQVSKWPDQKRKTSFQEAISWEQ